MVKGPAPGTKVAVIAGAMRSASHSRAEAGRPVRETGRDFLFSQRRDQDSALRGTLQDRNNKDKRPHGGGAGAREHYARVDGAAWSGGRRFAGRPTSASPPPVRNMEFLSPLTP